MVTSLKAILAIWVGVFLILPSCFCQLLIGLGFDVPGQKVGHEASISASATMKECHCDDEVSKVADTAVTQTVYEQPVFFALGMVSPMKPVLSGGSAHIFARGPPDGGSLSASTFRTLTCSWLV